jgi:seryl-tRNA synthetase
MHQRQEKLEKEVSTLKTSVVDCNEKIASVDKNISELIDNLPKIVSEQVSQIIDDKSEEVKRQSNVIFFGVPENE